MKIKTFNTMKKMMELTFSDNDHEALSALRQVNRLLAQDGLTWTRVLDRSITVLNEVEEDPQGAPAQRAPQRKTQVSQDAADIEAAFDLLDERKANLKYPVPKTGFWGFIDSLKEQFTERGTLSDAQKASLFKAASNVGGTR